MANKVKSLFLNFSWLDALDIILAALFIFLILYLLKKINLKGLIKYILIAFAALCAILIFREELRAAGVIAAAVAAAFLIVAVLLFSTEARRGLWKLASPRDNSQNFTTIYDCSDEELQAAVTEIVRSVQNMSKSNTGALIVLVNDSISKNIIESGVRLNAIASTPLIECIFNTKGPLHDGAVLIKGNKIVSAGCFLPLSQDLGLPKELGTRHRAALGVTEDSNVTTIIVSEETGVISVARGGELLRYFDGAMLAETLEQAFGLRASYTQSKRRTKTRTRATGDETQINLFNDEQ